jgi:hypothetical protein
MVVGTVEAVEAAVGHMEGRAMARTLRLRGGLMLDFDFCVVRESGGGKVTASLAGGRERERERERERKRTSQTQKGKLKRVGSSFLSTAEAFGYTRCSQR